MQLAFPSIRWVHAANALMSSLGRRVRHGRALSSSQIATALYRGILEREPDLAGLKHQVRYLRSGSALEQVVRGFIGSPEFRSSFLERLVPPVELPDLRISMPDKYEVERTSLGEIVVYVARSDADIALMASLIDKHRFYDRFGVRSPVIDLDKEITAAIVRGLGAQSCFELGMFHRPCYQSFGGCGYRSSRGRDKSSCLCVRLSEYPRRNALWRSSLAQH